jgi:hypothetical protein
MKITSCVYTDMNCYGNDSNCFGIDNIFGQAGVFPSSLNNRHFCNNDSPAGRDEPAAAPVVGIPAASFWNCAGNVDIGCIPSTNRGLDNCDRGNFSGHSLKMRKCSSKMRLPQKPNQAVSNNS